MKIYALALVSCALMYWLLIVLPLCALADVFRWLADRADGLGAVVFKRRRR